MKTAAFNELVNEYLIKIGTRSEENWAPTAAASKLI
jgi:hypothetical protein